MQYLVELDTGQTHLEGDPLLAIRAGRWAIGEYEGGLISGLTLKHVKQVDKTAELLHFPSEGERPKKVQVKNPKIGENEDLITGLFKLYKHRYTYRGFHEGFKRPPHHTIVDHLVRGVSYLRRGNKFPRMGL